MFLCLWHFFYKIYSWFYSKYWKLRIYILKIKHVPIAKKWSKYKWSLYHSTLENFPRNHMELSFLLSNSINISSALLHLLSRSWPSVTPRILAKWQLLSYSFMSVLDSEVYWYRCSYNKSLFSRLWQDREVKVGMLFWLYKFKWLKVK